MSVQIRQFVRGIAVVSTLVGCGAEPSSNVATIPNEYPFVQCTIKAAGKDVEAAVVGLHSKGGTSPKIVGHYDAESGAYRFGTVEGKTEKPGVPEGNYVVTVAPGRGSKVSIPGKYAKPQSSDLTLEVKKGDNLMVPLELKL
jgi:hypothetical protein